MNLKLLPHGPLVRWEDCPLGFALLGQHLVVKTLVFGCSYCNEYECPVNIPDPAEPGSKDDRFSTNSISPPELDDLVQPLTYALER